MSVNDHYVGLDGKVHRGLESLEDLLERRAIIDAAIHTAQERLRMLKGTGFIVIDPTAPRFDGEEMTDLEDAKNVGSGIAYKSGCAIIYAPVLVMRPRRETADISPSKLLAQLDKVRLPSGKPVTDVPA